MSLPQSDERERHQAKKSASNHAHLIQGIVLGCAKEAVTSAACLPPTRSHGLAYHRPLLLQGPQAPAARHALLTWFDGVSASRSMPWRKSWINPADHPDPSTLREVLERRAYEVWISEIMLQQTRVAVVIGYWNAWMARWPTIHDLSKAEPDDVLSQWRGLGYYSRATRIHEAARLVVSDQKMKGLLLSSAAELESKVPGIGRYTGGAISSIVFGHAAPMVDGNVLRVLSRQLGILGDVKSDKKVIDTLWQTADALAHAVAGDSNTANNPSSSQSDRPGRWGQGLMELGSTVCTLKPNCAACPITSTCRAYAEGQALAAARGLTDQEWPILEMEDAAELCSLCDPEGLAEDDAGVESTDKDTRIQGKNAKTTRNSKISSFFTSTRPIKKAADPAVMELIANHARKFPLRKAKKQLKEEHILVCAIRRWDGQYLIHRRPNKGLLAGLWELPSLTFPEPDWTKFKVRQSKAIQHVTSLLHESSKSQVKHIGEIGSLPWQFSHMKLTMHVHVFDLSQARGASASDCLSDAKEPQRKWVSSEELDLESMGTGMRKCWALVKEEVDVGDT